MAYVVLMAYIDATYLFMAYIGMACIVMVCMVMAYTVQHDICGTMLKSLLDRIYHARIRSWGRRPLVRILLLLAVRRVLNERISRPHHPCRLDCSPQPITGRVAPWRALACMRLSSCRRACAATLKDRRMRTGLLPIAMAVCSQCAKIERAPTVIVWRIPCCPVALCMSRSRRQRCG